MNRSAPAMVRLHFAAIHDQSSMPSRAGIRSLEAVGQLLANGLLDDPGPANPMSAFGSAMFKSPSIAKLAVTPPVVGSVRTEMYGTRARSSRARAPQTFAICISEGRLPSSGAPPEQHTITTGVRRSIARSIPRAIFSPRRRPCCRQ
jgi:hypothetical protein